MTRAFVLMTAMPPTKGHLHLIQFAARLCPEGVNVIVCTQPGEPYVFERVDSLREAVKGLNVWINHLHKELPQEPEIAIGFWDMWLDFLLQHGLQKDDVIVASEYYGKKLAQISGTKFMPYDIDRSIYWSKATDVRNHPRENFDEILPAFQRNLQLTVTMFGAESTGKTTLSRALAKKLNGYFLFEWARPYLETVGIDITDESMTDIWHGQRALQDHAFSDLHDRPFVFQDTDLFSTVGYWDFWKPGETPEKLIEDATFRRSDLYLITRSNIPFEKDPIRYGGDKRESDDQYWIDLCQRYGLKYHVLESSTPADRVSEARAIIEPLYDSSYVFDYVRQGQ